MLHGYVPVALRILLKLHQSIYSSAIQNLIQDRHILISIISNITEPNHQSTYQLSGRPLTFVNTVNIPWSRAT